MVMGHTPTMVSYLISQQFSQKMFDHPIPLTPPGPQRTRVRRDVQCYVARRDAVRRSLAEAGGQAGGGATYSWHTRPQTHLGETVLTGFPGPRIFWMGKLTSIRLRFGRKWT